ncbi:hypothetical protein [Aeromonas sp. R9-1]|uniref:hypothetical protein n=1 Tax=Aeromonas sp. R9-1 TaxID=3138478 RepID=UPI0034A46C34
MTRIKLDIDDEALAQLVIHELPAFLASLQARHDERQDDDRDEPLPAETPLH